MSKVNGNCVGCRTKIASKDCLSCSICNSKFDLLCANVSEKRFSSMDIAQKQNWRCQLCLVKLPKGDNTNTPIRSNSSLNTIPNDNRPLPNQNSSSNENVTKRSKRTTPVEYSTTNEDLRSIIREELNSMKQSLIEDLHSKFKNMVRQELLSIRNDLTSLEDGLKFINTEYENFKSDFTKQKDVILTLEKENSHLNNTVQDLSSRLQSMEQINRACNLELQCVPEHKNENLIATISQLSRTVSCEVTKDDIHHCTRVAKINKDDTRPRAIIVKLATPRLRDTLLAGVIKFNKTNPKDKLNTSHLGMGGTKQSIYVVEHLSPVNRKLHAAARQKAKTLGYKFVWTKQGRVFMRKTETSDFVFVKNQTILDNLK